MKIQNRCEKIVIEKLSKLPKRCNKCYYKENNKKKLCWIHYNKLYSKYIIIIQKYYRRYKCRKYINNIFIKLPIDLQYKIINYNRSDFYYNKYCNIIIKLIHKRFLLFYNLNITNYNLINYSDIEFMDIFNIIYDAYYFYNKYFDIIYCKTIAYNSNFKYILKKDISYLYLNSEHLNKKIKNLCVNYFYEISDTNILNTDLINIYNKLNNCLNYITVFQYKYSNYNNVFI